MNTINRLITDPWISIIFLTRLPIPFPGEIPRARITQAMGAFPLTGALIGAVSGLTYWGALELFRNIWVAAALAVTAHIVLTGAFHEDGLADTADALGGGKTREQKLEILRDSRIGTYGTCALALGLFLKIASIVSLLGPIGVLTALTVSGMLSRAAIVGVMFALPPAQDNGLSAEAGRPNQIVLIVAVLSAIGGTFLLLPPLSAALCCAGAALAATVMGALSQRHLGGQTGDVLGATQQVSELVILLTLLTQAAR